MSVKPLAGTAQTGGDAFAEAHRRLLGDTAIQFDLPSVNQPPQSAPDFSGTLPFLKGFFWIAVAAIGLFLLYLIVQRLAGAQWSWRRRRDEADAAAGADWRPEAREARGLLGEADVLAAEGRYSEAARLLLFRSIDDIDKRRPELVRPALTSRDIAALDAIPGRPRSAFARIAMLVERSLFGARPLAAGDWQDCRAAYEEFAFAEGWRG